METIAGTLQVTVKKVKSFWQKHILTRDFYGSTFSSTSLQPDRWIQREGYGEPNLSEKSFQLFSVFIV